MSDIRHDFPILQQDPPLVYLDSAATTQKPTTVVEAIKDYYYTYNANVHRAAHKLAEQATVALEESRRTMAEFIGATRPEEIIFTRGTTESINLVAACIGPLVNLAAGDEILISELEHHSNIVPWQLLCERTGATLTAAKVTPAGELDFDDLRDKLNERTKILAIAHVSNALGTVHPIADIIQLARAHGALTVIDGAQAPLHQIIDVRSLDCDFYACSGHKMFGPTGIGILYGKYALLDAMPPWHGGGEMIETVTLTQSTYQRPPFRFEAGTPNIAGIVGLRAAVNYLQSIDQAALIAQERSLVAQTLSGLQQIPGIHIVGTPKHRDAVVSFLFDGAHPHDVGTLLNEQGVAVRTGHHCAMPLMQALGIPGTVRASFSLYNNQADVDQLLRAVDKATSFL